MHIAHCIVLRSEMGGRWCRWVAICMGVEREKQRAELERQRTEVGRGGGGLSFVVLEGGW